MSNPAYPTNLVDTLPEKPSALLELALNDLEAVEKLPRYMVDMVDWHQLRTVYIMAKDGLGTESHVVCSVCLAGAVLAVSLKVPEDLRITPLALKDRRLSTKLLTIDDLRIGDVKSALDNLDIPLPPGLAASYDMPAYEKRHAYNDRASGPEEFKKAIRTLIRDLKAFDV